MVVFTYDIVIIGAGSAGIAAAVAASEQNRKVLVIEKQSYGGGKATAAEVGTICGLFHQGKHPCPTWLAAGFARKFTEKFLDADASNLISSDEGLHYIHYDIKRFRELVDDEFAEHQIDVWYNSELISVHSNSDTLTSIVVLKENERIEVNVNAFVDCSGNACVSELLDLEQITSNDYQAASRVFTIEGLSVDNEKVLSLAFWRAIIRGIKTGVLPDYFSQVFIVQGSLKSGKASVKFTIPIRVTHEKENMDALNTRSIEMIHFLVNYLKDQAGFSTINLVSIAQEVGVRTGPRPKGSVVITGEDVIHARKWPDTIARGAWPIEKWSIEKKVELVYLQDGTYYDIPAGCLLSPTVKNLFFAGRMISADETAIASARVMGICLQTGYAAGILASCLTNGLSQATAVELIQSKQILS
jgi:hypothetical protein